MEIDEVAARVFRRYWHVLLAAVLLPVAVVTAFYAGQPRVYAATARLVASDTLPKAAAEADAVVSEARAFATTRDVVTAAIGDAQVDRQVDDVLPRISVVGLGSSPLVDISVADGDADVARRLTQALAVRVVKQLNASRLGSAQAVLSNVDNQLTQLASRRAPLARAAELAPQDQTAQGRLAAIDRLISDLAASPELTGVGSGAAAAVEGAQSTGRVALERVRLLEELSAEVGTSAETEVTGLVVVAGSVTRLSAVNAVRDLQAASGWPVLGVLADRKRGSGARR
jgi:uncharacterized protein involved in exopolysaccharide biosynthesis